MDFKIKFKEAVFVRDEFLDFQEKTVEPSRLEQEIVADTGFDGLKKVTVKEIPSNLRDVSATTAQKDTVLQGKEFISADGLLVEGSMPNNGAVIETIDTQKTSYTIPKGYHNGEGTVSLFVESKTIEPTKTTQIVNPSQGKVLSEVNISPIPEEYIIPRGSVFITENGTYDVKNYAEAVVEVPKIDVTQATATEVDVKEGKTFYAGDDTLKVGTLTSENKLAKVIDRSVTEITASDLEGITSIGKYAFASCANLTKVEMPDRVTGIGREAFMGCGKLSRVVISGNTVSIGIQAFSGCSVLKEVYFNGDLTQWFSISFPSLYGPLYFGANLYIGNELAEDVVAPEGITKVPGYIFVGCASLTSIELPDSVTSIGESAFTNCANLTTAVIRCTKYSSSLFKGCTSLENVTLAEGAIQIYNYMFDGCTSLKNINIPASVTMIGPNYCFAGCTSLENVYLPMASVPTLSNTNSFNNVPTTCVFHIKAGTLSAYQSATNWSIITGTYTFVEDIE